MKMLSAAHAKDFFKLDTSHLAPREGTKLRELYDLLQANRGKPVKVALSKFCGYQHGIDQLRDFYGLDIRKVRQGVWLLAGEWFGATYRDYVADRFAKLERGMAP
jgi:hypothetical protein